MSNSGLQSSKSDSRNSDSRNAEMDQAIVEYMQACETGQFPDKQALLKKYARVADQLCTGTRCQSVQRISEIR